MCRILLFILALFTLSNLAAQDDCSSAYDLGLLSCGDSAADTGDSGTTPDPEATSCMIGLDGTWFSFITNDALQEFTISGTDYELFEGDCSSLNYLDGCSNGIVITADANTTYYILVNGNFNIDTPDSPVNDDCNMPLDASGGITGQTNLCANPDFALCGSDGNASVWYFLDLAQNLESLTIEIMSTGITDPVLGFYESCGVQLLEECSSIMVIECLPSGSYYIQVASDFDNAGTFDLDVTELVGGVSNETCDTAEDITPSTACVSESVNGDSTGACPETSNYGSSCDFDINPTVWFEFTTGGSTTSVDINNLSSNLELALIEGDCSGSVFPCIVGDVNFPVNSNETYLIAASLTTGGGSFSYDISLNEPPENDICANALPIGNMNFNTCCGNIEGIDQCGGMESGVWMVLQGADDFEGILYEFNNSSISGNIGIEIYSGDCGNLSLLNSVYCGGAGTYSFETSSCESFFHFIHVTSTDSGCGEFDLSVTALTGCSIAEDCGDGPTLAPSTGSGEECVSTCNLFACDSDCADSGVWFIVETDELATEMTVVVSDIGNADVDPVVSIIQSECSGSVLVACADVASGDIIETAVSGNQIYYIEVSSGSGGMPGEFELCVTTDESQVECSDGSIDVTRPEYPDADPDGPYCPGEIVNFCYEVNFTVDPIGQGNNCQWIQGIIPTVGGGWDLESMPLAAQGPGGSWFWLDEEEVEYQSPSSILGLIDTPNGLGLEYGPATLTDGDLLPGGWWSTSNGGGGCNNDGNPNTMWGLPASCGSSQEVEFCFDLQVGILDDISQCDDPDVTDLKVHIFTMADGQTGCWSNNSCSGDTPVTFNASIDCNSLVFVVAEDTEICSEEVLSLPVITENGDDLDIIVELIEEGNTSGASDWMFSGGQGVIADQIENEGDDVEIVIYEAFASDPASICEGPRTTIEVVVYPEIKIEGEDPYYICYQMPSEILPEVTGGDGGPYDYLWEDGSTDPSIILPENEDLLPGVYEILLTVTDNTGCSKTESIEYEIVEPVYPEIITPMGAVCKDGIEDLPELFLEFESAGTGPYEFLWQSSPGGLDFENGDNDQNLIINEEKSSARSYTIFGTVIDDYGCEYTTEAEFVVDNGLDLEFEIDECFGTAFNLVGYENNGLIINFELYYDAEDDWTFDGTTILEAELVAEQFGELINYFADDYGTYILLGKSSNACIDFVELELPPIPQPEFQVLPNDTLCAGEIFTVSILNSDEYVDYNWSNNVNGDFFMETAVDTVTYYLVAETIDSCEVIDSITIVVNPLPGINVTGSRSICPGSQTILTAQGNTDFSYLWTGPNGEMITTQSAAISSAGQWSLDVISSEGCINSTTLIVDENAQLDPQIAGANLCIGSNVILDGGPGFDAYFWLNENEDILGEEQTLEVLEGGTYILKVNLGTGPTACTGLDTFVVEQFDPITDALTAPGTEVCNIDNGLLSTIIDLTAFENGVNGNWFDVNNLPVANPQSVDFSGRNPGTYRYTFRSSDAMEPCPNLSFTFTINVLDCSCPNVDIGRPPNFCNLIDTFNLNLIKRTPENGSWSVEPSDIIINNNLLIIAESTPTGLYQLSFTLDDQNIPPDCSVDSTVSFTVYEKLDAELIQDITICNEDTGNGPDSLDLDDLIIQAAPGTWTTNETGLIINENNVVYFTGQNLGSYRFLYFMEDTLSACPAVTRAVNVEVINCSCPSLSVSPLDDLCNTGGNYSLDDYLDNPDNIPGSWTVTGPDASALVGGSVFASGRDPGVYEYTFSFTNPLGGSCINSVTASMNIFAPPQADVDEEAFACNGTNLTVYPTTLDFNEFVSGSEGIWTAPPSYNGGVISDIGNVDFEGLIPDTYIFKYTTTTADAPCMESEYFMNVIVRNCNCPTVNFVPPSPLCNDGPEVDLDDYLPSDAPEGIWSFENGTPQVSIGDSSEFSLDGLEGFYLFQYTLDTVPQGCPDFGQISIEVVAPPDVTHMPQSDVCNETSINAPLCVDLNDFISGVNGSWTIDPTFDGDVNDISNICFDQESNGEVFFFIFNTESGSVTCDERSYTTVFNVIDCSCPNLELLEAPELCNSQVNYDLRQLETINTSLGSWSFLDGPVALELIDGVVDIIGSESGTYLFAFNADDPGSSDCTASNEIEIDIFAQNIAGATMNSGDCLLKGDPIFLENYLTGQDSGGNWYLNGELIAEGVELTMLSTENRDPGLYQFQYGFVNNVPCDEILVDFEIIIMPDVTAESEDTPCVNTSEGSIIIASINTGQNLLYSIDGGLTWTDEALIDGLAPGVYSIMVEDEYGCTQTIENIVISEPEALDIYAGEDREVEENIGAITLEINSNRNQAEIAVVEWTENGIVICSGSPEQCWTIDVNPDEIGEYCVTITDVNGCVSTDCVVIRERLVKDVYIPTVFAPGSNTNDNIFYVQSDQYLETVDEFRIYDRWGNKVFEAEPGHEPNRNEYGWDGTMNDSNVEQGVYIYVIAVSFTDGEKEIYYGDLTLLRN